MNSVLRVCEILNRHGVEYLMVGGTAVAMHGYSRQSHTSSGNIAEKHDLDYWYNPTYPNYNKLLNALSELGFDVTKVKSEVAPNVKKSFFNKEFERFTIDFLPVVPGLPKFRAAHDNMHFAKINEIDVPCINYVDLIKSKEALGRGKDIDDIEQLRKRGLGPKK